MVLGIRMGVDGGISLRPPQDKMGVPGQLLALSSVPVGARLGTPTPSYSPLTPWWEVAFLLL